ncbi:hypothetical protein SNEBB_007233 [Seison nebaliae]|nr:hypothetical protein SNEBB_007233 [Seison nebaliae]
MMYSSDYNQNAFANSTPGVMEHIAGVLSMVKGTFMGIIQPQDMGGQPNGFAQGMYGNPAVGGPFDILIFLKKPKVILRIISWIFSIIIFGCIASQGYFDNQCLYNNDANTCRYGIGIGVFGFIVSTLFIILDIKFERTASLQHRRRIVLADLIVSALFAFLWFIGFCYLVTAWRQTSYDAKVWKGFSNLRAAIAFIFFSIITWTSLTTLAFFSYKQGAQAMYNMQSGYEDPTQTYSGVPAPIPTAMDNQQHGVLNMNRPVSNYQTTPYNSSVVPQQQQQQQQLQQQPISQQMNEQSNQYYNQSDGQQHQQQQLQQQPQTQNPNQNVAYNPQQLQHTQQQPVAQPQMQQQMSSMNQQQTDIQNLF